MFRRRVAVLLVVIYFIGINHQFVYANPQKPTGLNQIALSSVFNQDVSQIVKICEIINKAIQKNVITHQEQVNSIVKLFGENRQSLDDQLFALINGLLEKDILNFDTLIQILKIFQKVPKDGYSQSNFQIFLDISYFLFNGKIADAEIVSSFFFDFENMVKFVNTYQQYAENIAEIVKLFYSININRHLSPIYFLESFCFVPNLERKHLPIRRRLFANPVVQAIGTGINAEETMTIEGDVGTYRERKGTEDGENFSPSKRRKKTNGNNPQMILFTKILKIINNMKIEAEQKSALLEYILENYYIFLDDVFKQVTADELESLLKNIAVFVNFDQTFFVENILLNINISLQEKISDLEFFAEKTFKINDEGARFIYIQTLKDIGGLQEQKIFLNTFHSQLQEEKLKGVNIARLLYIYDSLLAIMPGSSERFFEEIQNLFSNLLEGVQELEDIQFLASMITLIRMQSKDECSIFLYKLLVTSNSVSQIKEIYELWEKTERAYNYEIINKIYNAFLPFSFANMKKETLLKIVKIILDKNIDEKSKAKFISFYFLSRKQHNREIVNSFDVNRLGELQEEYLYGISIETTRMLLIEVSKPQSNVAEIIKTLKPNEEYALRRFFSLSRREYVDVLHILGSKNVQLKNQLYNDLLDFNNAYRRERLISYTPLKLESEFILEDIQGIPKRSLFITLEGRIFNYVDEIVSTIRNFQIVNEVDLQKRLQLSYENFQLLLAGFPEISYILQSQIPETFPNFSDKFLKWVELIWMVLRSYEHVDTQEYNENGELVKTDSKRDGVDIVAFKSEMIQLFFYLASQQDLEILIKIEKIFHIIERVEESLIGQCLTIISADLGKFLNQIFETRRQPILINVRNHMGEKALRVRLNPNVLKELSERVSKMIELGIQHNIEYFADSVIKTGIMPTTNLSEELQTEIAELLKFKERELDGLPEFKREIMETNQNSFVNLFRIKGLYEFMLGEDSVMSFIDAGMNITRMLAGWNAKFNTIQIFSFLFTISRGENQNVRLLRFLFEVCWKFSLKYKNIEIRNFEKMLVSA